jgi:hypothetical protein
MICETDWLIYVKKKQAEEKGGKEPCDLISTHVSCSRRIIYLLLCASMGIGI